jgi:hypothetical protein
VTALESRLYISLLGARTIVAATANVNPQALKILRLVDSACDAYAKQRQRERPVEDDEDEQEEDGAHAPGN